MVRAEALVLDELGRVQLLRDVEIALVEALPDQAPDDGFGCLRQRCSFRYSVTVLDTGLQSQR
jgi:hypothetical protein